MSLNLFFKLSVYLLTSAFILSSICVHFLNNNPVFASPFSSALFSTISLGKFLAIYLFSAALNSPTEFVAQSRPASIRQGFRAFLAANNKSSVIKPHCNVLDSSHFDALFNINVNPLYTSERKTIKCMCHIKMMYIQDYILSVWKHALENILRNNVDLFIKMFFDLFYWKNRASFQVSAVKWGKISMYTSSSFHSIDKMCPTVSLQNQPAFICMTCIWNLSSIFCMWRRSCPQTTTVGE